MDLSKLEPGRAYMVTYRSRDIGYGVESGRGEHIYRGPFDTWGKHEFTPVGFGETVYLFPDEITEAV